jgi:hypothetical protein
VPEEDGTSERSIRTIIERSRTACIDQGIPESLWNEIVRAEVYISNRVATTKHNKTPIQWFLDDIFGAKEKHIPSLSNIRILGCKAYVYIQKEQRVTSRKLAPRAKIGILVGFEGNKIYRVYVPGRRDIVRTSHVTFDESGMITSMGSAEDEIPEEMPLFTENRNRDVEENPSADNNDVPEISINRDREKMRILDHDNTLLSDDDFADAEETPRVTELSDDDEQGVTVPEPTQTEQVDTENSAVEHDDAGSTAPKKRGRPLGSKNKQPVVLPADERPNTRARTRASGQEQRDLAAFSVDAELMNNKNWFHYALHSAPDESIYSDPKTLEEAMSRKDASKWRAAVISEYRSLARKKTWKVVQRDRVPKGQRVLKGKLVFKTKLDKNGDIERYKVRWVVLGCLQRKGRDYDQTFAGVCKSSTWKIALALAAEYDLEIEQMDVDTAFLNSDVDSEVYVDLPPGWAEPDYTYNENDCCKLLKGLYGLKQSPRLWQAKLKASLRVLGFEPLLTDNCVYINRETRIIIITYVDDMLVIGKAGPALETVKYELATQFTIQDLGPAAYFVGVRITRDRQAKKIYLCQDAYIKKILERFDLSNCKHVDTPCASGFENIMLPFDGESPPEHVKLYQSMVGSLMYLATHTRPDIAYAVSMMARFLTNPSPQHIAAARRVFQYLQGTVFLCVVYGGQGDAESMKLQGYSDAEWGQYRADRKSHGGHLFYFMNGVVHVESKKQTLVAASSTESEYYSLARAIQMALWLKDVFSELGYKKPDVQSIDICGDNQGALALGENPEFHSRTKHISIKYHFVRDYVERRDVQLFYLPTEVMPADGLTKSFANTKHKGFVELLNLQELPERFRPA